MANAVVPRLQGDDYQARFFWHEACRLFMAHTKVVRVGFDVNGVKAFDDVVVFYDPTIPDEFGNPTSVDYYQVKFHVDHAGAFTAAALTDPEFIGATAVSLLERLRDAQQALAPGGLGARFHVVSPWPIDHADVLGELVGDRGALRLHLLFDGKKKSNMAKLRAEWRAYLSLRDDESLRQVLQPLRLRANFPDLDGLRDNLNMSCLAAGLKPVDDGSPLHPYDDLAKKLRAQGRTVFTRDELRAECERASLWLGRVEPDDESAAAQLGLRSFTRWAENMEDETERMLCLVPHFDGRGVRDGERWDGTILPAVRDFLAGATQELRSYHLHLDTHASIAFAAGYCVDGKSGCRITPVQRTRGGKVVWRVQDGAPYPDLLWREEPHRPCSLDDPRGCRDVALAVSITHDVVADVEHYVARHLPRVGRIMVATLAPRPSPRGVRDGSHAVQLAEALAALVRTRTAEERAGVLHIFAAAPNAFMFFLGQLARSFGRLVLYEYDFDTNLPGAYQASITLPPPDGA